MSLPAATARKPLVRAGFAFAPSVMPRNVRGQRYGCGRVFVPDGESDLAARLPHHLVKDWCSMSQGTAKHFCAIDGCDRTGASSGRALLCAPHDLRKRKYGDPLAGPPITPKTPTGGPCSHQDCPRTAERCGMCHAHYQRSLDGRPMDAPIRERAALGPYQRNTGQSCSEGDCGASATRKGMCENHYRRATGQGAARSMVRRARKYAAPYEDITAEDLLALLAATDDCYLCGKPLAAPIEFDHVIPLARHGHHVLSNIRPTHKRCNRVKWASLPPDVAAAERGGG